MSAGLPRGAPLSAHLAIVAISSSLSDGSLWNFWMPMLRSTYHGGITPALRSHAGALLDRARPRAHVLVADERHRRDAGRPVAVLAAALEDGRDVLREGDVGRNAAAAACVRPCGASETKTCGNDATPARRSRRTSHEHPSHTLLADDGSNSNFTAGAPMPYKSNGSRRVSSRGFRGSCHRRARTSLNDAERRTLRPAPRRRRDHASEHQLRAELHVPRLQDVQRPQPRRARRSC